MTEKELTDARTWEMTKAELVRQLVPDALVDFLWESIVPPTKPTDDEWKRAIRDAIDLAASTNTTTQLTLPEIANLIAEDQGAPP